MKNIICCIIGATVFISCWNNDNVADTSGLLGDDYRLFQNTPLWELAKAVRDQDTTLIRNIVKMKEIDVDYQEPRFGKTLLMLAVMNHHYKSSKTLLKLGADPNKHNTYDGASAIITASKMETNENDNIKFLELLLVNNGNPNDVEVGARPEGSSSRQTPLIAACENQFGSPIKKVKLLVEAGADINYKSEFDETSLRSALISNHYDVVLYLLERGADFKSVISKVDGKEYYLWDELRFALLPLGSEEYQQKMRIVNFLRQNGIDYRKAPIPDYAVTQAKSCIPKIGRNI